MAITEKYVSSAGAGSGDGSSAGNARSWANMVSDINGGGTGGNRYNVIGTISRGATDTISGSGSVTSPVIIRGYASTIGDGYQGRTSNTGALVTTNMAVLTYSSTFRLNITGTFIILESFDITGTVSSSLTPIGADSVMKSCVVQNASTNGAAIGVVVGARSTVIDCDIALTGGSGGSTAAQATNVQCRVIGCHITGGAGAPGLVATSSAVVVNNLIYSSTTGLVMNSTSGSPTIVGNTIVSCSTEAINIITGTTTLQCMVDNMLTDGTTNGLNMVSTSNGSVLAYNRLRDNGTNIANGGDWITATSYGHVTSGNGTSDYTNSGSGDYTLISTSPAVGAGLPYPTSIGAYQRASSGGVSGSRQFLGVCPQ